MKSIHEKILSALTAKSYILRLSLTGALLCSFLIDLDGWKLWAQNKKNKKPPKELPLKEPKEGWAKLGPLGIKGTFKNGKISVQGVDKGSPADGKLKKGDVVIGVEGESLDKRYVGKVLTPAILKAEVTGKLELDLANKKSVSLNIQRLGEFSPSAPYNCPKTDKLITMAAESIGEFGTKNLGSSHTSIELLGLMATGEKKYLDKAYKKIQEYKKIKINGKSLLADSQHAVNSWTTAYHTILMSEYYLQCADQEILPPLTKYAMSLVEGQDPAGLYGHKLADPATRRAPGYGQMNQVSIAALIGMQLAKKCGVNVNGLDAAIKRSLDYVKLHIDKGGFPYGFHGPRANDMNNNGTSSSAAVAMSLDQHEKGTKFFSKISGATYNKMGSGHASSLFSALWTPLGAQFMGPKVTEKFFIKSQNYFTPRRLWDGSYIKGYSEGRIVGVALLAYCIPRKALMITGKEANPSLFSNEEKADEIINLRSLTSSEAETKDLLKLLNHDVVHVRSDAVRELIERHVGPKGKKAVTMSKEAKRKVEARKTEIQALLPTFETMLKEGTHHEKMAMLRLYFNISPQEKFHDALSISKRIMVSVDEPLDLRIRAAEMLGMHDLKDNFNDILKVMMEERDDDPFWEVDAKIAGILDGYMGRQYREKKSPSFFENGLVTDKELFYKASIRLMKHKRQTIRGVGVKMVQGIPRQDLHLVINELDHILKDDDKTYHSYHNPSIAINPVAKIYDKHNIKEGMYGLFDMLESPSGKWGFKIRAFMDAFPKYGGHAKELIPRLMEIKNIKVMYAQDKNAKENGQSGNRFMKKFENMLETINNDKNPPKMVSVEDIKKESI